MKSFIGKTHFTFSFIEDQDINLLDISMYYRLLEITRAILLYKKEYQSLVEW